MDLNNNKKLVKERFISKDCFMVTSLYPKVTIFPLLFQLYCRVELQFPKDFEASLAIFIAK